MVMSNQKISEIPKLGKVEYMSWGKSLAKELRIGNIVMRHNDLGQLEDVILLPGMIVECSEFPDLYKPIPLTPELLENFGFVLGARIEILVEQGEHLTRRIILDGYDNGGLKYLHQLQNMYFALTGEEL